MKAYLIIIAILCSGFFSWSQAGNKPKEKAPTQKEMDDMMKEAQKMMNEMSADDKKMMDSMGIKLPDVNKMKKDASGISDAQLAEAWEDETRIVPKRDAARIAAIPNAVTDAKMPAYITAIQSKVSETFKPGVIAMANKVYNYVRSNSKNSTEAGNMAAAFWIAGYPELSLCLLGKVCAGDATNIDNINNYASMLTMLGAQHLAIPVLNNLNIKFPKNSTVLNNLGQAWFGLGEIGKAEKYLDSVIRIYGYHPQANLTKAAIEEHKGNTEKAREAVKRSMQHSYTKEKEEKLSKLGYKIKDKDFRLPRPPKADQLNLGSFKAPSFPGSVDECIVAEKEWLEFYRQIDEKISQLNKQRNQASETAVKSYQQRMNTDMAMVKAAMANPGMTGQFTSVPLYADRAAKKLKAFTDLHTKKLEAFLKKSADYMKNTGVKLKKAYDDEIERLSKEDAEQTGEGLPNKDYCPKYKAASDAYLSAINPKCQEIYEEYLGLIKELLNESAYWQLYIQWPDMFEVYKLGYMMDWLGTIKQGTEGTGGSSTFPYVSITKYVCQSKEKEPKQTQLRKFDDIACKYNDTVDLKVMAFYNNCSRMTSKFDLKFIEYTRWDDFERAEGDTYTGSTIKVSVEKGFDKVKFENGPLKVEAKIGVAVELEFDRGGVKDVIVSGEAKAGAGHNTYDTGLEEGGSLGGKDVIDTTVEIGVEGRISIITGHGEVKGTGVMRNIKIAKW